ncbi:unnamed protein product [Caenorhabditis sp. 36 PRJEB53466]|nr:unnamed protein product [Caenorhabditis sp. 36 PRJEB53466]
MFMGTSSPASPQIVSGCSSSGCVPATIVPRTSGFWPNADVLTGLQIEQQQTQNQLVQQDDSGNVVSGNVVNPSGSSSTAQPPVIYIARAGSDQYKYSVVSSTQSPLGSGVGWNSNGFQSSFGNSGNQNTNTFSQGQGSSGNQNQNAFGQSSSNSGTFNGNQFQQGFSNSNSGFNNQNSQNSFSQGSSNSGVQSGFQNRFGGSSGGVQNGQNDQNQSNQGAVNGQMGAQSTFGASSGMMNNDQNGFGTSSSSGNFNGPNAQNQNPFSQNSNANQGQAGNSFQQNQMPFGPPVVSSNSQFGPMQPGNQGVHYVGGGDANNGGAGSSGMTDEAKQIAVQIQAIRDNLSITQNESNYLIGQLKASLPPELQSQLQSV